MVGAETQAKRIVVWEKLDGEMEVVTGRHRLDLAKRSGIENIRALVIRASDGFTQEDAIILDAESNIKDNQGELKDYAYYFKNTGITRQDAHKRGLLSEDKGRQGWALGQEAVSALYDVFANEKVSGPKLAAIAAAAPNNEPAQMIALRQLRANRSLTTDQLRFRTQQIARMDGVDVVSSEQATFGEIGARLDILKLSGHISPNR